MEIKHEQYVWWGKDALKEEISGTITRIDPVIDKHTGQQRTTKYGDLLWYIILDPTIHEYHELKIQINDKQKEGFYKYTIGKSGTLTHENNTLTFLEGVFRDTIIEQNEPVDTLKPQSCLEEFFENAVNNELCVEWIDKKITETKKDLKVLEKIRGELL